MAKGWFNRAWAIEQKERRTLAAMMRNTDAVVRVIDERTGINPREGRQIPCAGGEIPSGSGDYPLDHATIDPQTA